MFFEFMGTRTQILVRGIVQGVGFRPFVYSLAKTRGLRGSVLNNESGVLIDIEGSDANIDYFIEDLKRNPPPLASIESVTRNNGVRAESFQDFQILPSESNGQKFQPISADISTCDDCVAEMFDPNNRRYRYPFINCTNCGPRFTIIEDVPYDRASTTMREFEMCAACRAEYEDPLDRRFHAEPTACADCGPQIYLGSPTGRDANANDHASLQKPARNKGETIDSSRNELIEASVQYLRDGKIVAVKGIGGYHLVCDALNPDTVKRLRQRKYREDKPFALMAASVEVVEQFCEVSDAEKELLNSRERPIVLVAKKSNADIPEAVAPGVSTLGFMLPYTPLHYLLFENLDAPLVMTSGNISDEPICYRDEEADVRLNDIADHFLTNNRRIHIRTDDSIVRAMTVPKVDDKKRFRPVGLMANGTFAAPVAMLRRSRGFAPAPIKTSFKFETQILACGSELKNTFCLTKDKYAFLSHHIGDLENLETLRSFTDGIEHFKRLFDLEPEVIAYDLHPEYLSTKYAHKCESVETKIGVQHHHAHIASCLADNGATGEVIGVALDGLGFGTDQKMWGGEFFVADFANAERVAHLDYVPMPGGAKAIGEPWRMAAVYLQLAFGEEFLNLDIPFIDSLDPEKWRTLDSMIAKNTNCPETSSMGRLFDAISAMLCLRNTVNYEGQAAIALEAAADESSSETYEFTLAEGGIIKTEGLIEQAVADILDGVSAGKVSAKFHFAVAKLIADVATNLRDQRNLNRVALSGGVFQNIFLLQAASVLLAERGFEVLTHSRVPTNDGGISLGQAAIANAILKKGSY
ncbi:MAG: carbamoyltransferase HypF [Pyrinomonadaceae bacterium]